MLINSRSLFVLSYLFLILGFYFGEDLNGNAKEDYIGQFHIIEEFAKNPIYAFENYSSLEGGLSRQSPMFFYLISILYKILPSSDLLRFLNLNLNFLSIFIFYKCISLIFDNQKKLLITLISIIIVFSPSFRSIAIWPNGINLGLLFFLISLFFFLKFKNTEEEKIKFKYAILNTLFLAFSSYISPNFSVFVIFFLYNYFLSFKKKNIIKIIITNISLSFPAIYYVFIDNNYFIFNNHVSENIDNTLNFSLVVNKIAIISTITFFHISPFLLVEKYYYEKIKNNLLLKSIIILLILILISNSFDYDYEIGGGGIFFKMSNFLFGNNYLFYFFIFITFLFLYELTKNFQNFLLLLCLLLSNPQYSIYHKYFDPLILIIWFLLFIKKGDFQKNYFKKENILILYLFYLTFICLNYFKSFI